MKSCDESVIAARKCGPFFLLLCVEIRYFNYPVFLYIHHCQVIKLIWLSPFNGTERKQIVEVGRVVEREADNRSEE